MSTTRPDRRAWKLPQQTLLAAIIAVTFLLVASAAPLPAQPHAVPDEAEAVALLLRGMAEETAAEAASACGAGPLLLRVLPDDALPTARQVFAEELMERGVSVRTAGGQSACVLTVEIRALRSSTVSSGNSSYLRKIESVVGLLLEQPDGAVVLSRERRRERSDTLAGDAPYDERSYLPGEVSWWQSWIEPALVTVTAAVVVVLLFTVRGSS